MDAATPNSRFSEFNLDPALAETVGTAPAEQIIEGILRLEDPNKIPPHFSVVSRFNRICTGRFPAAQAWTIRRHPNVISFNAARPLGVSYDGEDLAELILPRETGIRPSSPAPFGGRGCIVAALDFGLDFAHPNFLNPDGTTRLVAFWHQGATYDAAHPNRYGYGRVFLREEINAALRASDPYQALDYHPAISDTGNGSHGTHTLDIAAGNGRAGGARAAPASNANLMFIHLSTPRLGVVGDLGDSVRVLEALDHVDRTARGRPWVVNLSVGRTAGSHDGTSLVEQGMHELLRLGPGRAIVQSAGNYRSANLCVEGWLRDGEHRDLEWIIDPADTTANEIDAWYSGKDRFVIAIRPPQGSAFVEVKLGEVADIVQEGAVIGRIYHRKNDPNNRDNHGEVFLYSGAPPGVWTVRLIGEYVISGRFHAWIERDLARPGAQSRFDAKITSQSYTLGTIATSPLVITVGAYDAHAEGMPLALFSSCGPTRDERRDKPELLAPGVGVVAARSIPRDALRQEGLLVARSGTSMAAPHVTGTVAAMFEAAGRPVSIDEIRDCLKRSAEPVTDGDHADCWAWGRLDTAGAIRAIQGLPEAKLVSAPRGDAFAPDLPVVTFEPAISEAATGDFASVSEEQEMEVPLDEGALMNSDAAGHFLDRVEHALRSSHGRRRESEILFLQRLLRELGGQVSAVGLSPAELLRAVLNNRPLMQRARDVLEVLAMPSQRPKDALRPGDWLLRAVPGTGDVGHVSVLASGNLLPPFALASEGIATESVQPGYYGLVIESGAFPHDRSQLFARRMLDSRGRVLPNTVVLRPRYSDLGVLTDFPPDEPESNGVQRAVAIEEIEEFAGCPLADDVGREALVEQAPQARFRTVFYDRESLRYLDGWTRATGPPAVLLIDRPIYDTIRADGARRGRAFDQFLAQALAAAGRGRMDLMPPVFGFDPTLATVPLNRESRGDWDDLMIAQLIDAGRRLTIQSERDQWTLINRLFANASADAREAVQRQRAAREFAAYFVLDVIKAPLALVEVTNVTMQDGHAIIPLGRVRGTDRRVVPGGDAAARVIGDIHTHYLFDPLIDLNRSSVGTTIRSSQTSLHSGVSDIDVASARNDHLVVYAVDSKYLHRANPNGTKNDKLSRSGDVLREALRVFGGEPGLSLSG